MTPTLSRQFLVTITLAFVCSCSQKAEPIVQGKSASPSASTRFYSRTVNDSFSISVSLPEGYNAGKRYPVIYLLDANLYFDIIATTLSKYSMLGLAPEAVLVGIGYKDFQELDSLRSRDYTFPVAIPEYEMAVSGGADRFSHFLSTELIPHIDSSYNTDTSRRILMGHSLGGYLTGYALLQSLQGRQNSFSGFIAASPSLHYNHYYLLEKFKAAGSGQESKKLKAYFTAGQLEDEEDADDPGMKKVADVANEMNRLFALKLSKTVAFQFDIYSNLGHMDTPIPGFIKGIQWTLMAEE